MAQGGREGVGDVGRLGQLRQAQLALHGALHLVLRRPAVALCHIYAQKLAA